MTQWRTRDKCKVLFWETGLVLIKGALIPLF